MLPSLSHNSESDNRRANAVLCRQVSVPYSASGVSAPDFDYSLFCELRIPAFGTPWDFLKLQFSCMLLILFACAPFKIVNMVVGFDGVFVVYLRKIVGIGDEGFSDKPMHRRCETFSVFVKNYMGVSHGIRGTSQTAILSSPVPSSYTAYFPERGNFIETFVSRDGFPDFHARHIIPTHPKRQAVWL